jgi:hypothetical protein
MEHVCNPSYKRGIGKKVEVSWWPRQKVGDLPYLKITKSKKGYLSLAQVEECLPSKCKVPSSNPSPQFTIRNIISNMKIEIFGKMDAKF